jgi:hypothetical protein
MAEENDDGKGKAGAAGDGKADGAGGGSGDGKGKAGAAGDGKEKTGADKTYSQAEYDAAVAAARQEARKGKTAKAVTGKTAKKDGDESEESPELIEARKRAEKAEADLRVRDARDAVETAAKGAGFSNPSKIYRLLRDDLSFDDSGKPENVKDLIAIAKRDFPEELAQKSNGSADGGAGARSGAGAGTSMNDIIRRAAGRQ